MSEWSGGQLQPAHADQVGEDDLLGSSHGGIVEPQPYGRVLVPQATSG